jgi:hypothetical protein
MRTPFWNSALDASSAVGDQTLPQPLPRLLTPSTSADALPPFATDHASHDQSHDEADWRLLVYRLAVGATVGGAVVGWNVIPILLVVTIESIVLGVILARLTLCLTAAIKDVATAVIVQFVSTFGVWILAERLHLSGILTMVVYAMTAARDNVVSPRT